MKRFIIVIAILSLAFASSAQVPTLSDLGETLQGLTNEIAPVLPVNSTVGSTWSDAYIGPLLVLPPHFGAGLTTGVTMIPGSALDGLLGLMKVESSSIPGLDVIAQYGLPFPAVALNARVGGFILPFDVGVKVGWIPDQLNLKDLLPDMEFTYLLYGADVRYALLVEKKNFIDLSVSAGYDFLKGSVEMPLSIGAQSFTFTVPAPTIPDPTATASHTLALSAPSLYLGWESQALDFTVQASKQILFLTPYVGAGLTLGRPLVTSGLKSELTLDGVAIDQADVTALAATLAKAGLALPVDPATLTEGILFNSPAVDGTDLRVYGGVSLDIFIIRLDLNALYSFVGKNFGANIGLRVQL